ncbi:TadE/TadG family type IV pilus assembly protein [Roseovarius arcticus]|uniref:TadE/TadG family type IV pilus assembly protein n=1 Tax=Roseovarius arcticus TaxID=2547404 RepID=UPI001FE8C3F6|nr:TadE/TadG family type IV pilus assembly protein [Roseovarius arcticus]
MSSKTRKFIAMATGQADRRAGQFRQDEDGAVVAFTLFFLVMMLIAGGVAVDVMRHEMQRARLQNTLDTAVLAAAGAPYGSKPKEIVEDYFAKAEMSSYLNEIDDDGEGGDDDIVQTVNTSKVSASADMTLQTYLMKLAGVNQLTAFTASSAERRVPKLEVSMVLDVSGSMDSNSKLVNLKKAGKKFVTTILDSSTLGDAVISIVPFSWDVSPGENIIVSLDVDVRHDYSTCLQFTNDDFNSAAINPEEEQVQLIYTSEYDYGFDNLNDVYRTCYNEPNAEILPYSISESDLHTKIESLEAKGNTSGNMGMKWGAALLDPKFEVIKTALNGKTDADGTKLVDDRVGDVPSPYNEAETLKVIVMMGDGQNTYSNQFPLNSSFRGPNSYLHYVEWDELEFEYAYNKYKSNKRKDDESYCTKKDWECVYSAVSHSSYFLYDPDDNKYKNLDTGERLETWEFNELLTSDGFQSHDQKTWEQAWGKMSPDFMDKENGYGVAEDEFESYSNRVQGSEKDAQMSNICTAIKNQGVVVYTIGFEVPSDGTAERELKKCATSDAHYYRANGIDITDAFSSIASNVVNLRLTQ